MLNLYFDWPNKIIGGKTYTTKILIHSSRLTLLEKCMPTILVVIFMIRSFWLLTILVAIFSWLIKVSVNAQHVYLQPHDWHLGLCRNSVDKKARAGISKPLQSTNECYHKNNQLFNQLTLKVLNFWKFASYCSLKPLWSGMGEAVPARTSPTLHPPSPPSVHQLSRLAL